jgi:hypothetical protein
MTSSWMSGWWFVWVAFMFVFLVAPMGYGWGYRGWGPPYPRYIQRRRGSTAAANGGNPAFDHHSWGVAGDLMWIALIVGTVWVCSALWIR